MIWKHEGIVNGFRVQSVLDQETTESVIAGMIRDRFAIRECEKVQRGSLFLDDGSQWRVGLLGDRLLIIGIEDPLIWEEMVE